MLARAAFAVALAIPFLGLAGCGPAKLDVTKNYTLDPAGEHTYAIDLDAQSKPQTLNVEYEAADSEVTVAVYKASEAEDLETLQTSKAIKSESGKKSGKLTVEVPENTATRVVVGDSKAKTAVKLRVTNRQ